MLTAPARTPSCPPCYFQENGITKTKGGSLIGVLRLITAEFHVRYPATMVLLYSEDSPKTYQNNHDEMHKYFFNLHFSLISSVLMCP